MSYLSVEAQYRSVQASSVTSKTTVTSDGGNTQVTSEETAKSVNAAQMDVFVKSGKTEDVTYSNQKRLTAEQLNGLRDEQSASLTRMLTSMLGTQANKAANGKNQMQNLLSGLTSPNIQGTNDLKEDSQWGVDAVATRIMDMAVSLSGGDTSKLSVLKGAVEKAFKSVGSTLGSKTPSITGQTHSEILKRFDYWEKNGSLDSYKYQS